MPLQLLQLDLGPVGCNIIWMFPYFGSSYHGCGHLHLSVQFVVPMTCMVRSMVTLLFV